MAYVITVTIEVGVCVCVCVSLSLSLSLSIYIYIYIYKKLIFNFKKKNIKNEEYFYNIIKSNKTI
jgi:hypothetical protein